VSRFGEEVHLVAEQPRWLEARGLTKTYGGVRALDNASLKRGLKLLWFATGRADFLIETSRSSVALMKKHGFSPVFVESEGGHTWLNWRDYLSEFAPQLFR